MAAVLLPASPYPALHGLLQNAHENAIRVGWNLSSSRMQIPPLPFRNSSALAMADGATTLYLYYTAAEMHTYFAASVTVAAVLLLFFGALGAWCGVCSARRKGTWASGPTGLGTALGLGGRPTTLGAFQPAPQITLLFPVSPPTLGAGVNSAGPGAVPVALPPGDAGGDGGDDPQPMPYGYRAPAAAAAMAAWADGDMSPKAEPVALAAMDEDADAAMRKGLLEGYGQGHGQGQGGPGEGQWMPTTEPIPSAPLSSSASYVNPELRMAWEKEEVGCRPACCCCTRRGCCLPGGCFARLCGCPVHRGPRRLRRFNCTLGFLALFSAGSLCASSIFGVLSFSGVVSRAFALSQTLADGQSTLISDIFKVGRAGYGASGQNNGGMIYELQQLHPSPPPSVLWPAVELSASYNNTFLGAYAVAGAAYAASDAMQGATQYVLLAATLGTAFPVTATLFALLWSLCACTGVTRAKGKGSRRCHATAVCCGPVLATLLCVAAVLASAPLFLVADACADPEATAVSMLTYAAPEWRKITIHPDDDDTSGEIAATDDDPSDPTPSADDDDHSDSGNNNNGKAPTRGYFVPPGGINAWLGQSAKAYFSSCPAILNGSWTSSSAAAAAADETPAVDVLAALAAFPAASTTLSARPSPSPSPRPAPSLPALVTSLTSVAGGDIPAQTALLTAALYAWRKNPPKAVVGTLMELQAAAGYLANASAAASSQFSCENVYTQWVDAVNRVCDGPLYSTWLAMTLLLSVASALSVVAASYVSVYYTLYWHPSYRVLYVEYADIEDDDAAAAAAAAAAAKAAGGEGGGRQDGGAGSGYLPPVAAAMGAGTGAGAAAATASSPASAGGYMLPLSPAYSTASTAYSQAGGQQMPGRGGMGGMGGPSPAVTVTSYTIQAPGMGMGGGMGAGAGAGAGAGVQFYPDLQQYYTGPASGMRDPYGRVMPLPTSPASQGYGMGAGMGSQQQQQQQQQVYSGAYPGGVATPGLVVGRPTPSRPPRTAPRWA
jgi:hypothetical protein